MHSLLISSRHSCACKKSDIRQQLYEEPNGKMVSSCNFISSDSIWFINLNSSEKKCCLQCAKSAAWHRADTGYTPWLHSLNSFSLYASILCQRLKIASGLLQNKQFMDSGFDAMFAWRGQLSPACRKNRPHQWFLIHSGLWTLAVTQNGCVSASILQFWKNFGIYNCFLSNTLTQRWLLCVCVGIFTWKNVIWNEQNP